MEPLLVGRDMELRVISSALDQTAAGRGSLILLAGEPGIGKSRLLDESARLATAAGARAVAGRSWEAGGAPSYWIWTETLRTLVSDLGREWWNERMPDWAHELADILPEVGPAPPRGTPVEPAEARFQLFTAVARFLELAATDRLLVVLLDDLHAADTASLLLLRFLVRHVHDRRLLLIGGYRDVELTALHPLTATLEAAMAVNVVGEHPSAQGLLRFSHVLVRDALHDELTPARRASLHKKAGVTLEAMRQGDLDPHLSELAVHFMAAGSGEDRSKVMGYSRRAGDRAMGLLAFDEAARSYSLAITAIDTSVPGAHELRLPLLLAMAQAESRAGATARSKETYLTAASLARELGRAQEFAVAALGYGGRFPWLRAGDDTLLVPLLREALEAVRDDVPQRARLLARLSGALRDEADRAERARLSEEALVLADATPDARLRAYARIARYAAIWGPDSQDECLRLVREADELAHQAGDNERISDAGWMQVVATLASGDAQTARIIESQFSQVAVELRQPAQRWYVGVIRTVLRLMEGPLGGVEALIDETLEAGRVALGRDAEVSYRLAIAFLRWEEGRLPDMEGLVARSVSEYPGYRLFRCLLALVHAEAGRADRAAALAREILELGDRALAPDNGWLFGMSTLAEVATQVHDVDLAERLYSSLAPFEHLVAAAAGEVIGGSVSRSLGQLAATLGRFDDAERHLADALSVHRHMGANVWTAHTLYDYAVSLIRRAKVADRERASRMLATALALCQQNGMVLLAGKIAALGVAPAPHDRTAPQPGSLTARESEVASLVANGLSNREIADRLFVSERTVETHVQNILRKLDCRSRTQVAAWVISRTGGGT